MRARLVPLKGTIYLDETHASVLYFLNTPLAYHARLGAGILGRRLLF
jgi:hypothetical protein